MVYGARKKEIGVQVRSGKGIITKGSRIVFFEQRKDGDMRWVILVLFIFTLVMPVRMFADQDALIGSIITKQKSIKTLVADFTQEKHSEMLTEPLISEGVFKYKAPEKVLWSYEGQLKIASDGKDLTVYYTELNEAEIVPVRKSLVRLPLNFNLEEFRRYFSLSVKEEKKSYEVTLTPLDDASMFSKMIIQLREDGIPITVEMFEKTGDRSIIRFKNQKTNKDLPDSDFIVNLPDDAKVRRVQEP